MAEKPEPVVPVAVPGTVGIDLPCFTCGYNLRSLAIDGVCTECGKPVQHTLRGTWLILADKQWLRRLLRGITILL